MAQNQEFYPNSAPLLREDFQDIIDPLPAPSELPIIQMRRKQVQIFPPEHIPNRSAHTNYFISPPKLKRTN